MEVNRSNFDVLVKSVLVEQNRTPSMMFHIEPIHQVLLVKIFNCFLQDDDVPLHRNVLLDSSFFSASGSWISAVDAEPLLFGQAIGVEAVFLVGWRMFPRFVPRETQD